VREDHWGVHSGGCGGGGARGANHGFVCEKACSCNTGKRGVVAWEATVAGGGEGEAKEALHFGSGKGGMGFNSLGGQVCVHIDEYSDVYSHEDPDVMKADEGIRAGGRTSAYFLADSSPLARKPTRRGVTPFCSHHKVRQVTSLSRERQSRNPTPPIPT